MTEVRVQILHIDWSMFRTLILPLGTITLTASLVSIDGRDRPTGTAPNEQATLFSAAAHQPALDTGRSRGVAWGDMNQDGLPDVLLSKWDQPLGLYRNTGTGFVRDEELLDFSGGPAVPQLEGASWVDIDNDGDSDLYVVSRSAGRAFAFERTDAGRFQHRASEVLRMSDVSASMVCWADVDSDGDLDAFVVGYRDSDNRFLHNQGQWQFTVVTPPSAALGGGSSRTCAWGDLENDGMPDLFVGEAQRPNVLLENQGNWQFTVVRNDHIGEHVAYSYGASWADYDDDGDLDLFVANFDRENVLYENREGQLVAVESNGAIVTDVGASKGHTWGDFDLDGDLDLYVANGTPAPDMHNYYYTNQGDGLFARADAGAATAHADTSAGAASADYDRDGDLDIVVASWGSAGTRARVYENQTRERAWVKVRLVGVRSNRAGIGAQVSAYARIGGESRVQHRWILASTGYASQDLSVAHFGLGDASRVDSLLIRWPGSGRDMHRDVSADILWTAMEGGHLAESG